MLKRLTDIIVSAIALLVFSPVIGVIFVMIRCTLGSPAIFRHVRPGKEAKLFTMYKFRTMRPNVDASGNLRDTRDPRDAERLTQLGRFLRATSLDELPELWNVLRGDMSLVGPRPLLTEYLGLYNARQIKRQDVRPGITGWAQVNGRNSLNWDDRLELDVWYVENGSFWLDLKILLKTFWIVFKRHGISSPGHVTQPLFTGNRDGQKKEQGTELTPRTVRGEE